MTQLFENPSYLPSPRVIHLSEQNCSTDYREYRTVQYNKSWKDWRYRESRLNYRTRRTDVMHQGMSHEYRKGIALFFYIKNAYRCPGILLCPFPLTLPSRTIQFDSWHSQPNQIFAPLSLSCPICTSALTWKVHILQIAPDDPSKFHLGM